MVDSRLLVRIDAAIGIAYLWLVLAAFFVMSLDTVAGVLALAAVVLTGGIAAWSFLSARDES